VVIEWRDPLSDRGPRSNGPRYGSEKGERRAIAGKPPVSCAIQKPSTDDNSVVYKGSCGTGIDSKATAKIRKKERGLSREKEKWKLQSSVFGGSEVRAEKNGKSSGEAQMCYRRLSILGRGSLGMKGPRHHALGGGY